MRPCTTIFAMTSLCMDSSDFPVSSDFNVFFSYFSKVPRYSSLSRPAPPRYSLPPGNDDDDDVAAAAAVAVFRHEEREKV